MRSEVPARVSRQQSLAPFERVSQADCVVVGCGAVGRQLALQLAAMGVRSLRLFDHDTVEEVNMGPQAWRPDQLGARKASALAADCRSLSPGTTVVPEDRAFGKADRAAAAGRYVFSAVDSITARGVIHGACVAGGALWLGDARVAGETVRVVCDAPPFVNYGKTLFSQEEAFRGSCTAKMTVYLAALAASLVASKFAQFLRGVPLATGPSDLLMNLLSCELEG